MVILPLGAKERATLGTTVFEGLILGPIESEGPKERAKERMVDGWSSMFLNKYATQ